MEEQKEIIEKEPYYLALDSEIVNGIEDVIYLIKWTLPNDKRVKLHRSKFFEIFLKSVIFDFKQNKKQSYVNSVILDWCNSDKD